MNSINTSVRRVVILRGISGSGKSTYVARNFPSAHVCSADRYFVDVLGDGTNYNFDPRKLNEAHQWCMRSFIEALTMTNVPLIVVDNTNCQLWEFMGYVQIAQALGCKVEIIRMDTPVHVAAKRNVHGVPMHSVENMHRRFQNIPPFLNIRETIVKGV
jgi:predicted kinase